jgi:hypothetical protein
MGAFFLIAGFLQDAAPATAPTREQLAERFVRAATPEPLPLDDSEADMMADELMRSNPGREADARRIAGEMAVCMSQDGHAAMRRAALEAALAFDKEQLERLIAFVEMQKAAQGEGASNRLPRGWEAIRRDYGRWMYSIAVQPSAVALARRCGDQMAASMAAAGLRD